jgi:hypothetical protein
MARRLALNAIPGMLELLKAHAYARAVQRPILDLAVSIKSLRAAGETNGEA